MITIELYRIDVSTPEFVRFEVIHDHFNLSWSDKLNDYGRASFSLNLFSTKARPENLIRYRTQVVIKDNNSIRWVGLVSRVSASVEGVAGVVNVECLGYFAHLASRYTDSLKIYETQPLQDIIWDLIDSTQGKDNGSLLITRGNAPTLSNSQISYEYKPISEAITDYADNLNGFDFDLSYTTDESSLLTGITFNIYQSLGSLRNDLYPLKIGETVNSCSISTLGDIYNHGVMEGAGTTAGVVVAESENVGSQIGYTRREVVTARKDISEKNTLQEKIDTLVNDSSAERYDIYVELKPNTTVSSGAVSVGDILNMELATSPASYVNYTGTGRVEEIFYSVDGTGVVTVTPKLTIGV